MRRRSITMKPLHVPAALLQWMSSSEASPPRSWASCSAEDRLMTRLRRLASAALFLASATLLAAQIPTSFRVGPYGEMTSRPWLDPGAGARSVLSIASVGEVRVDLGVRRPHITNSDAFLVGTATGTLQYNAAGG